MRRKFTQKEVKQYIYTGIAEDITHYNFNEIEKLRKDCGGFDVVGCSYGTYGINGCVVQGRNGNFYAVTKRSTAVFQIS